MLAGKQLNSKEDHRDSELLNLFSSTVCSDRTVLVSHYEGQNG